MLKKFSSENPNIIYGHIGQVNGTSDEDEKDADSFAGEMLIPSKALNQFIREGKYDITALSRFAEQVDVDVGILVGRLQHDRVINYSQFNNLRKIYQLDKKIGGA